MGAVPWRMNTADMISDEVLLDSGRTFQVTDPYYYEDALRDGIVQEVRGHPDWEARVDFLRMFRRGKFLSINRSTIEQIVQQEWIGAG